MKGCHLLAAFMAYILSFWRLIENEGIIPQSHLFICILTTEFQINFSKNLSKSTINYLEDKDLLGKIRNSCQVSPALSTLPFVSAD